MKLISLIFAAVWMMQDLSGYESNVKFTIFRENRKAASSHYITDSDIGSCDTHAKLTFITHGWRESINSAWVEPMVGNFSELRGGCIIFIDYSYYSNTSNYIMLLSSFNGVSNVITKKLIELEHRGFNPDDWFMFGHSAGARLVIEAASNFGFQRVAEIDVCELAGPGFDQNPLTMHPQNAAKNVACIHTSSFAGTGHRLCHQNWMMGNCGRDQPASQFWKWMYCQTTSLCDSSLYESHGLCPHFYNSAFQNDFVADNSVNNCSTNRAPSRLIDGFKMGYTERRKSSNIIGDFFAPTSVLPPWNVKKKVQ